MTTVRVALRHNPKQCFYKRGELRLRKIPTEFFLTENRGTEKIFLGSSRGIWDTGQGWDVGDTGQGCE